MKESGARVGKRASRGRDCSLWPRCTSCSSLHKDPEPRVMGLPGKESGQDILPASSPSRSWGSGASHSAEPKENHGAPADVGPACHGAYHGAALEFAFFGRELPTKAASPPPKYHAGPWASEPSLPWDLTPLRSGVADGFASRGLDGGDADFAIRSAATGTGASRGAETGAVVTAAAASGESRTGVGFESMVSRSTCRSRCLRACFDVNDFSGEIV